MLSVLIPARNEQYLEQTIRNVLQNARGDIEILVALDGYLPQLDINDSRVICHHEPVSIGQRQSVNKLARLAKGEYLMKLDAHCAVDEGFDVKLQEDYQEGWVVVPRMYNLDINTFQPKRHKKTDYMYIGWNDKGQLRSLYYGGQQYKEMHRRPELIDDTMGCMGPCRFTSTKTFWDLGGCDEGHGGWGSEGIEWACKAWLSGGALKVNKKTWFAHWFRGGSGPGFPYPMRQSDIDKARQHAENLWLQDKWPLQKRTFRSLVEQFNPPTWENYYNDMDTSKEWDSIASQMYKHIHREGHRPKYKGVELQKFPSDIQLYHQAIWEKKPEVLVEIGTRYGGSALFFADQGPRTITIDISDQVKDKDPRIEYIFKSSLDQDVINYIHETTKDKTTMLVIDGKHTSSHVIRELRNYWDIVTPGQFMVVEDCYVDRGLYGPGEARDIFLKESDKFIKTDYHKEFLWGVTNGGWLLRQ